MANRIVKDGEFNNINVTEKGSFDLLMTGATAPFTLTVRYIKQNGIVSLWIPNFSVTSASGGNLVSDVSTKIPSNLRPFIDSSAISDYQFTSSLISGSLNGGTVAMIVYIGLDGSFSTYPVGGFSGGDTFILANTPTITYVSN
jgi:hypothetical protein